MVTLSKDLIHNYCIQEMYKFELFESYEYGYLNVGGDSTCNPYAHHACAGTTRALYYIRAS